MSKLQPRPFTAGIAGLHLEQTPLGRRVATLDFSPVFQGRGHDVSYVHHVARATSESVVETSAMANTYTSLYCHILFSTKN